MLALIADTDPEFTRGSPHPAARQTSVCGKTRPHLAPPWKNYLAVLCVESPANIYRVAAQVFRSLAEAVGIITNLTFLGEKVSCFCQIGQSRLRNETKDARGNVPPHRFDAHFVCDFRCRDTRPCVHAADIFDNGV
jgi:hypothetical protein